MYSGMAPAATLLAAKVLDCSGNGNVESVLRGIEWLKGIRKEHPLRIVNISVGTQPELKEEQKARLLSAVEELWDEGLVVVASAGNYGPGEGTVALRQQSEGDHCGGAGYAGGSNGSCRPHEAIISCNAGYGAAGEPPYIMKTGTSMATPVISGAIACLLSRYPDMTNVEVKLNGTHA